MSEALAKPLLQSSAGSIVDNSMKAWQTPLNIYSYAYGAVQHGSNDPTINSVRLISGKFVLSIPRLSIFDVSVKYTIQIWAREILQQIQFLLHRLHLLEADCCLC